MESANERCVFLPPLDIVVNHPLLKISRHELSVIYYGMILVDAKMYHIQVKEFYDEDVKKIELLNIDSLEERFSGISAKIRNIKEVNITSYLRTLVEIFKWYNPPLKNYCPIYRKVISEFTEFSKFYIDLRMLELSPKLSSIRVCFADQSNREHIIEFGVDYEENTDIFFFKEYDVPVNKKNILEAKSSNLKELYNMFLGYIEELQPFFEFMDMVDANCVVVDPKYCSRKQNYRRISLEKNFSVIITVDPCNINSCPKFAFVGPDRLIKEYQCRIQENLENWDNQGFLYEQILLLMGLDSFPKELDNSFSENLENNVLKTDNDCSICFSSELRGSLPDIVCDNKCCENVYHGECLFEWLSSIDSRKYFNEIQGPCPNCEKTISCPIFN